MPKSLIFVEILSVIYSNQQMEFQSSLTNELNEHFTVLLVSKNNLADCNEWLSPFEIVLTEEDAASGAKRMLHLSSAWGCALGVGEAPTKESLRKVAHKAVAMANEYKQNVLNFSYLAELTPENTTAISEAIALSNYQFLKYKSEKKENSLQQVNFLGISLEEIEAAIQKGKTMAEVVCITRDLVNEPVSTLTAEKLAETAVELGQKYGFSTDVFGKAKIQSLKMGGLLAVNLGSQLPPTFTIMEYKPEKAVNEKPVILVGKGVVYDTGGLSLKPTANSMDYMKCDMAGAGAVIGAMCGAAALKLNVHLIGLIPATDNRPGENAYVPGDVITMYDGSTVEVLNTDAEGRMILADALTYAKQYEPELVIDLATLTGASVVAIGGIGLAMMGTASEETKAKLKVAGENAYERLVEFPLWDEYGEMIKSDIADVKNIGGSEAGAITAGKFLERFTTYPWIHLDIAGAAWSKSPDNYRGKGGTGVGVRLLLEFLAKR
ncbi:MAG: leucyl aminopeptidase family protein [Bacteroidia bacterium]